MTEREDSKRYVYFTLNLTENVYCKHYDWHEYDQNCKHINLILFILLTAGNIKLLRMASEYCKPINLSYAYQQQKIENAKILQKKTKKH